MIEQLRPLKGQYNYHIIPVLRLISKFRNEPKNYMTSRDINVFLSEYNINSFDLFYLVEHEILQMHTETGELGEAVYVFSYTESDQDELYDLNVIENVKTILKDFIGTSPELYPLASVLLKHYETAEVPYIIDLLQYEGVIKKVFISKSTSQEYIV